MSRLLLASRGLGALPALDLPAGGRAVYVPTAGARFRDAWVRELPQALTALGLRVEVLELEERSRRAVARAVRGADVLAVGGGDPFRLLRWCLAVRLGPVAADALAHGTTWIGVSAGAMVAGPDLRPVAPSAPPRDLPLAGLGLVDVLVLPHDDDPDRAAFNAAAAVRFAQVSIVRITDDQAVLVEGGRWRVVSSARAGSPRGRR